MLSLSSTVAGVIPATARFRKKRGSAFMDFRTVVARYEQVLRADSAWLSEGLAWTVVLPRSEPLTQAEVGRRLTGGGRPAMSEFDEVDDRDLVYLGQPERPRCSSNPTGSPMPAHPRVLAWLSQDAQVWHVSWNLTGTSRMCYAADGHLLADVHRLESAVATGVASDTIAAELAMLRAAARWWSRRSLAWLPR
ncbi:hypothetical protein [Nonomuraea sp. JJY05]|uniref:hypothetical protein n=1 Tax=Nonomuraea sp. JJY05 TaxID=3350255 RepID=UPI00373FC19A